MKRKRLNKREPKSRKHRLTLREALDRIKHAKIYSDYSIPPVLKRYTKSVYKDVVSDIKMVVPEAKVTTLPKKWLVRGRVKDPWQDIRVSNITAGQAFMIAMRLMPKTVTWKG